MAEDPPSSSTGLLAKGRVWLHEGLGMKSGQIKSLEEPFLSLKKVVSEEEATASGFKRIPQSERVQRAIDAACEHAEGKFGEKTPGWIIWVREHKAIVGGIWRVLVTVGKVYLWLYTRLAMVIRALPQQALLMLFGITLAFFGGTYVATLAAVEAFKQIGGARLYTELLYVRGQLQLVGEASRKDDDQDENKTGIADVDEISPPELLKRKMSVVLVTITEPQRLQSAVGALWAAYLAALATLKMQFAFVVSVALGMADVVKIPAVRILAPMLAPLFGAKFKHWAEPSITTLINLIAMATAWYLQMVIAAVYSGLRGARIFATALVTFLADTLLPRLPASFQQGEPHAWLLMGIKKDNFDPDDTYVDEVVGAITFAGGLWFQLSHFFALPFPLDLVLLPVSICEGFLRWQITFFTPDSQAQSALAG